MSPTAGMSVGRTGTPYASTGGAVGLGNGQSPHYSSVPQQRMAEKQYIPTDAMRAGSPGARMDDLPPTDPVVVPAGMDRSVPQGVSGAFRGGVKPTDLPPLPGGADHAADVGQAAMTPPSPEPPPVGPALGVPPAGELPPSPSGGRHPELTLPAPPNP
jgi:hypothetical protein